MEALSLLQQGRDLGALAKYLQAREKLTNPSSTLLYTIGEIYERTGDLDNAEIEYEKATKAKKNPVAQNGNYIDTQDEDKRKAKDALARIKSKPRVQFDLSGAPRDLRIVINNLDVTSSALYKPLRRNPGTYFIDAIAGGRWTRLGPIELRAPGPYIFTIGEDGSGVTITGSNGARSSRAVGLPGCDRPLANQEDAPQTSTSAAVTKAPPLGAKAQQEPEATQTQPPSAGPSTGVVVARTVGLLGLGLGTFASFAWLGNALADQRNPANVVLGVTTVALLTTGAGAGLVWITLGKRERSPHSPTASVGVGASTLTFRSTF
jgi:tetratricopeptide (TPR) repeat protein